MANTNAHEVTTPVDDTEWETLATGSLGEEWNFDAYGPLVGNFLGTKEVETTKVDSGHATAILFAPVAAPDTQVFIWQSADLESFSDPDMFRVGDRVRVMFLGRKSFTGGDGKPRQIKQYRVQVPKQNGAVVR